jgi:DNA-binding transcriptional ArsR family regulator
MNFLCLTADDGAQLAHAQPSEIELVNAGRSLGALADPTRLRVAAVLATSTELCVGDTAALLGLPVKLVSHHMRTLADRGLATRSRHGKLVRYCLTDGARALLEAALGRPLTARIPVRTHAAAEVAP